MSQLPSNGQIPPTQPPAAAPQTDNSQTFAQLAEETQQQSPSAPQATAGQPTPQAAAPQAPDPQITPVAGELAQPPAPQPPQQIPPAQQQNATPLIDPNAAAPQQPDKTVPTEPPVTVVRDAMLAQGNQNVASYTSDADLLADLGKISQQAQYVSQQKHLIRAGQEYLENADEFAHYRQQQEAQLAAKQQPQVDPSQPESQWQSWQAPEYDPTWKEDYENPLAAQKLNRFNKLQQSTLEGMTIDPYELMLKAGLGAELEKIKSTMLTKEQGEKQSIDIWNQKQAEQATQQYVEQNLKDLYVHDAQGNPVIDPQTNDYQLAPKGQAMLFHSQQARYLGVTDEEAIRKYAIQHTERDLAMTNAGQQPFAQPAQQQVTPQPVTAAAYNPAQPPIHPSLVPGQASIAPVPALPGMTPQQAVNQQLKDQYTQQGHLIQEALTQQANNPLPYEPPRGTEIAKAANQQIFEQTTDLNFKNMLEQDMQAAGHLPAPTG